MGLVVRRAGHRHVHAALEAADDNGVGHVVAVADVADLEALQLGLVLPNGHQIRQHLAGVAEVREPVDDGNGAVFRQILHLLLGKGADHDAVAVAAEDPGGVLHRLAPANLAYRIGEEQGVAPQLEHAHLKGYPGPGGVLGKDHRQGLSFQYLVGDAVLLVVLELIRQVQDLMDLLPAQIQQL